MEVINEMTVLTVSLILLNMSDYNDDAKARYSLGWVLIAIVSANIIIQIAISFVLSIYGLF